MVLTKSNAENSTGCEDIIILDLTASQKRRIRRKKLLLARTGHIVKPENKINQKSILHIAPKELESVEVSKTINKKIPNEKDNNILENTKRVLKIEMSSKEIHDKSRDSILAAREAKKSAKQKAKNKNETVNDETKDLATAKTPKSHSEIKKEIPGAVDKNKNEKVSINLDKQSQLELKSKDEVDKATKHTDAVIEIGDKNKEQIKAERAAKKAAKQAKKKGVADGGDAPPPSTNQMVENNLTVKDVVETLNDIVNVAKEVQEVTAKVNAIDLEAKKPEEDKSKAELRAERRAKQEAQRLAKQAAAQQKIDKPKPESKPAAGAVKSAAGAVKVKEEKLPIQKSIEKPKLKSQSVQRVNWFQNLYKEHNKDALKNITINSNFHPAIVKLGAQLAAGVVTGSNARCIALLDALKKMVKDYTLPAKTEFARGLESHLASSLEFLWSMRQPSASQTNAVKFFRHHLTQLPNNVDEFDAKKTLQEEIDRYIREQIDMAGEAISIAVRNKISTGDNILTYGCSSLIERILREAWEAGVQFRTVVVGNRVHGGGRRMARRLARLALPCTYVDVTALSFVMPTTNKVVLGASALLVDGCVVGAAGTAQVALAARARNVPVLVACETHKFSDRVQTDAFVYNEIGDPDDLIDKSDENSPLKDWRSNPNLTPLNLTYDVTPPSLVTAVVTELAILPCTSAPVVLRFKLSEYGI